MDRVSFRVLVVYALLWASVQITDAQLAAAAALAAGVAPELAAVGGRRLARRMQNVFRVSVERLVSQVI